MSTPFSVEGVLNLPGSPGLEADPLPFGISSSYNSKAEFELVLPSTPGSQDVNFGTMPAVGVKLMLLVYELLTGAEPITVTINGADTPIEIATGGFIAIGSPVPVDGVTTLTVNYEGAGRVFVWLLG